MGLAPTAHVLFNKFLRFTAKNPRWANRDAFLLSNGHSCALEYSIMYLCGYDYSIDDLKHFRQLHSKTPGHPEAGMPGIEVTTGPLGQGISNAVGYAIAQKQFQARFNKPEFELFDAYTYAFAGDGCLMEGVASEASSLAGHLQLDNLIVFYDDNHITIDGDINFAFTENVLERYRAYGWNTLSVDNADTDLDSIYNAIIEAQKSTNKPTLIKVRTTIGYGSKNQGTAAVHGSPLKPDDVAEIKKKWGFDPAKTFQVPPKVLDFYKKTIAKNDKLESDWNTLFDSYSSKYPDQAAEIKRRLATELPKDWEKLVPVFTPNDKELATRKLSEMVIDKIFDPLPELIGGSADLTGSNLTRASDATDFQPPSTGLGDYSGRYIRYGVREHGMGAILNGLAAHGGIIPYGGTFLNFISYGSGALRLAALSHLRVIWVGTHDSIGLGEDGPTHQPIETLAHLRAIPNLMVWRPADGNETSAAYIQAISSKTTPSVIALSRQNLPQLSGSSIEKAKKGGYVIYSSDKKPEIRLVATGSEVSLSIEAAKLLKSTGIEASVVSLPDWHTFDTQPADYRLSIFPDGPPIMSVEVLSTVGWQKYAHESFGLDAFGASGAYKDVYANFGFTPKNIAEKAEKVVQFYKEKSLKSPIRHAL